MFVEEDLPGDEPEKDEVDSTEPFMAFATEAEFKKARTGWRKRDVSGRDKTIAKLQAELDELREESESGSDQTDAAAVAQTKFEKEQKKLQAQIDDLATKNTAHEQEKRDRSINRFAEKLAKEAGVHADWRGQAALILMADADIDVQEDGSVAVADAAKGIPLIGKEAQQWAESVLKNSPFLQAKPSPSPVPGAGNPGRGGPTKKPWNELNALERMNRATGVE